VSLGKVLDIRCREMVEADLGKRRSAVSSTRVWRLRQYHEAALSCQAF